MQHSDLVTKLIEADRQYYGAGPSVYSDAEYDQMRERAMAETPNDEYFKLVGYEAQRGNTVKHRMVAGSQEKKKTTAEFDAWSTEGERMAHLAGHEFSIVTEWKADGLTLVLEYGEDCRLISAATRGDGITGEDVTENYLLTKNAVRVVDIGPCTVRGELVLYKDEFEKHFKPLGYENTRNSTGIIRSGSTSPSLISKLTMVAFDAVGVDVETELNKLEWLDRQGFITVGRWVVTDQWNFHFHDMAALRDSVPYSVDGSVHKWMNVADQESAGMSSSNRPKGQCCLKFETMKAETETTGIVITIRKDGELVPTLKFNPVRIGGVTVKSVLCNNISYMMDNHGGKLGTKVIIELGGDIIPHIHSVVSEGTEPLKIPDECPYCGAPLIKTNTGLACSKPSECCGAGSKLLLTWVTKRNIKGLGPVLVDTMFNQNNIRSVSRLYGLDVTAVSMMNRGAGVVGDSAYDIIDELDKSRECTLPDMIGSLGIAFLGRTTAADLTGKLGMLSIDDWLALTPEKVMSVPGYKEAKAYGICDGIRNMSDEIRAVYAAMSIVEEKKVKTVSNSLAGLTFCFTGPVTKTDASGKRYTRDMLHSEVTTHGGTPAESVKKGLSYLVVAPGFTSTKTEKAEKLGVKVITEDGFFAMLG